MTVILKRKANYKLDNMTICQYCKTSIDGNITSMGKKTIRSNAT